MTRKGSPCPASAALSHAFPADADDALRAHLAECPACAAEWAACERLAELGRELPRGLPTAQRRDDVRRALLAAASRTLPRTGRPHRLLPWAAAAATLCAGLAVAMFALAGGGAADRATTSPGASRRATLHPQADAVFAVVGVQPDEIVRLSRGTLTVEVAPLRPGERFRVATADAQVEVRGTVFDVVASDDRLAAVRVLRGRVEVRPTGRTAVVLDAGQHWDAAPAVAQTPAPPAAQCPPEPPPPAVAPVLATPAPPGLPPPPAVPVLARPVPRRDPPAPPAPEAATTMPAVAPLATEPRAATEPAGRESAEQAFGRRWTPATTSSPRRRFVAPPTWRATNPWPRMPRSGMRWRSAATAGTPRQASPSTHSWRGSRGRLAPARPPPCSGGSSSPPVTELPPRPASVPRSTTRSRPSGKVRAAASRRHEPRTLPLDAHAFRDLCPDRRGR
jgi:ferric-dicitrate binding protein FerR (iron transport regulator)